MSTGAGPADGDRADEAPEGRQREGEVAGAQTQAPTIAVLTLSPALDLTLRVPSLEPGLSHRAAPAAEVLGGKGINVARVLDAVGVAASAHGPVARGHWPTGADPRSTAAETAPAGSTETSGSSLIWELTPTPAPLRRSFAVVEDSGAATVINESAHPHPAEVWAQLRDTVERRLADPALTVLVVSGSTPEDCPADLLPELIAAAHAADVEVIVDTSAQGLLAAARAGADWVKPNAEELRELFGDDPAAAGRLIDEGAGHVLLSLGADGMVLIDPTGPRLRARLDEVLQGNPTGAGDAAVAALAWGLADHLGGSDNPDDSGDHLGDSDNYLSDDAAAEILTRAVALSASAVLMPQAGQVHPSWPQLRARVHLSDIHPDHQRTGAHP